VLVAVVDIGSNSTRLLIADVDPSSNSVSELLRRSTVTRLGHGVDATNTLSQDAIQRVLDTLQQYRSYIDQHHVTANLAVLTSAVRDAGNGAQFAELVRSQFHLDARVLTGEQEAQLTFLGAMSAAPSQQPHAADEPTVVIDIGGGSTEFVVGVGQTASVHTSLHAGVVRMSERHIHSDPPNPQQLQALASDVHTTFLNGLPPDQLALVTDGIAVAGTATAAAAIDLELDPYDPTRVHHYKLQLGTVELLLARLADMNEAQRRQVVGLHPDRAPTIVAGMILLQQAMQAFQLQQVTVSEHDILYGGALQLAGQAKFDLRG
jgi:exopolyphosphatase / guanosine-5'-triphosphate,3'-diphosphate pyrophosphatase